MYPVGAASSGHYSKGVLLFLITVNGQPSIGEGFYSRGSLLFELSAKMKST